MQLYLSPRAQTSKNFVSRNRIDAAGFVFCISPLTFRRPERIGLLFRNIFEAVQQLAGKFGASRQGKFERLGDRSLSSRAMAAAFYQRGSGA